MSNTTVQNFSYRRSVFTEGIHDGIPIALGYFAVSFSLGIAARNAGLSPFQGFLVSLLCNASAGEYAGFTMIAANAAYIQIALITLIANARYLLMSCALSQKMSSDLPMIHRILVGFDVTDELFGIAIAREGIFDPLYSYGAMLVAIPGWSLGTALGVAVGNILPVRIVSALSVALYGMFIAIIIPPAKKDKVIAFLVIISFVSSYVFSYFHLFSEGTSTIILTAAISALVALIFPRKEEEENAA